MSSSAEQFGFLFGSLVVALLLVVVSSFLLKKLFQNKSFSSIPRIWLLVTADFLVPVAMLFIHADGPTGATPYLVVALVVFLADLWKEKSKGKSPEKQEGHSNTKTDL